MAASDVCPTEDSINIFLEYLIDPILLAKQFQQELVAKQMHAVVLLYNYYHRKQHLQLKYESFESFCKLVVVLKPALLPYMKLMVRSDDIELDDPEHQLSLTEKAIMEACDISKSLDASRDISSTEGWPISKIAIFLIDSSKESCFLHFGSVTQGVWSVIEKDVDVSINISQGITEGKHKSKKIKITRNQVREEYGADESGFRDLAFSAVKEATGINQGDLVIMRKAVVYSLGKEKTAAWFYVMQCTLPKDDVVFQTPIKHVVDSLQGSLVVRNAGQWTFTRAVEYFHLLPYAGILSGLLSSDSLCNSTKDVKLQSGSTSISSFEMTEVFKQPEGLDSQDLSYINRSHCLGNAVAISTKSPRHPVNNEFYVIGSSGNLQVDACSTVCPKENKCKKPDAQFPFGHEQRKKSPDSLDDLKGTVDIEDKSITNNIIDLIGDGIPVLPMDKTRKRASMKDDKKDRPFKPSQETNFTPVRISSGFTPFVSTAPSTSTSPSCPGTNRSARIIFRDPVDFRRKEQAMAPLKDKVKAAVETLDDWELVFYKEPGVKISKQESVLNSKKLCLIVADNMWTDVDKLDLDTYSAEDLRANAIVHLMKALHFCNGTIRHGFADDKKVQKVHEALASCEEEKKQIEQKLKNTRAALKASEDSASQKLLANEDEIGDLKSQIDKFVEEFHKLKALHQEEMEELKLKFIEEKKEIAQRLKEALMVGFWTRVAQSYRTGWHDRGVVEGKRKYNGPDAFDKACNTTSTLSDDEGDKVEDTSTPEGDGDSPADPVTVNPIDPIEIDARHQPSPNVAKASLPSTFAAVHEPNLNDTSERDQELDGICHDNNWTLPTYHVWSSDVGFKAKVTLKAVDFECSCEGDASPNPREARESAAMQMLGKLRNMASQK